MQWSSVLRALWEKGNFISGNVCSANKITQAEGVHFKSRLQTSESRELYSMIHKGETGVEKMLLQTEIKIHLSTLMYEGLFG